MNVYEAYLAVSYDLYVVYDAITISLTAMTGDDDVTADIPQVNQTERWINMELYGRLFTYLLTS